jgi:hypothetical protein
LIARATAEATVPLWKKDDLERMSECRPLRKAASDKRKADPVRQAMRKKAIEMGLPISDDEELELELPPGWSVTISALGYIAWLIVRSARC